MNGRGHRLAVELLQEKQQRQTSCECRKKERAFETGPRGKESGGEKGWGRPMCWPRLI